MLDNTNTYSYLDKACNRFYSPKKIISYNRPWNFIAGSRSIGKSTGLSIFCIIDFILNDNKFIYTRRTRDETLLTCQTFFNSAVIIINDKTNLNINDFKYDRGDYYIATSVNDKGEKDWVHCGTIVPLSIEDKFKSSNFSQYSNLIFDEFIPQDDTKYLGTKDTPDKEYRKLLSLYQTIDRGVDRPFRNETRFFMLANTATIYNPIYLKLGIPDYIVPGAKFIRPKDKLWIVEMIESVEATSDIKDSFAFRLSDEENRNYAYKNKGRDNDEFIGVPDISQYFFTVRLGGSEYGIVKGLNDGNMYIVNGKPGHRVISLDVKGHTKDDLMMITAWRESPIMLTVTEMYKRGRLYFANGKIKSIFMKYLNFV